MQAKSDRLQNEQNKLLIKKIYNKVDNLKAIMNSGSSSEIESKKLGMTKNNPAISCEEILDTNIYAVSG